MAVAGSTRMQATSSELLVVGAALENALKGLLQRYLPARALSNLECDPRQSLDHAERMGRIVAQLGEPASCRPIKPPSTG